MYVPQTARIQMFAIKMTAAVLIGAMAAASSTLLFMDTTVVTDMDPRLLLVMEQVCGMRVCVRVCVYLPPLASTLPASLSAALTSVYGLQHFPRPATFK